MEPDANASNRRRRRDPAAAAQAQADAARDNGVGACYETPAERHERRADGLDPHEDPA